MPGGPDVGRNLEDLKQANKGRKKKRPTKQMVAIALDQARRAGGKVAPPPKK